MAAALGRDVCKALLGLHLWTSCDPVSTFARQGKLKALKKILFHNQKFREAFTEFGHNWDIPNEVFNIIYKFTCQLYCHNTKVNEVIELQHQMFCSSGGGGGTESGQLPPCVDTFATHMSSKLSGCHLVKDLDKLSRYSQHERRTWMDSKRRPQPRCQVDDGFPSSRSRSMSDAKRVLWLDLAGHLTGLTSSMD